MKNVVTQVLGTIIAAGILANVSMWYSFGQRLARIETKLENIELSRLAKR